MNPFTDSKLQSALESLLFSTNKPQTLSSFKETFRDCKDVTQQKIQKTLERIQTEYDKEERGITLEKVAGGWQLRTKSENREFLQKTLKARPFRVSEASLEALAIVAYHQPCIKAKVDEIRGVESSHLMRTLMDKGLIQFTGKSELPGKPMLYKTTGRFLEIFALNSLKDLPSLQEMESLIPDGILEEEEGKTSLHSMMENLSHQAQNSYSQEEAELDEITQQLSEVSTTTTYFEEEKKAQKAKRIQEALNNQKEVSQKDIQWFEDHQEEKQKATDS